MDSEGGHVHKTVPGKKEGWTRSFDLHLNGGGDPFIEHKSLETGRTPWG